MTELRVTVKNTSETGGTFLTPFYFGFHDGSFDLFEEGAAASAGLESLAEDGSSALLADERQAADADSQGLVVTGAAGPIAAQEVTSGRITVDGASNGSVSYAAMVLPSNDAFVGSDDALELFDSYGGFKGAQTITLQGSDVYDAGTEVNTELNAAFLNQTAPNTGVTEGGTIQQHQGFNGSEGTQANILGGTTAPGAVVDPVAGDFTRNGGAEEMMQIEVTATELPDGTFDVTVSVTNTAPEGGTFLTPVWFGFHDGGFDLYNRGEAVSAGLEALAEDGAVAPVGAEFAAATGANGAAGVTTGGPIAPGATATQTINVDPALVGPGYFSWASMVVPSNDAFLASPGDPLTDPIFDADGNFIGLSLTRSGNDVLDAGTEVNTETDAAFLNQTAPNTGVDQGGTVQQHQGYNGSEGSPVNILGGTNAFGEAITEAADFTRAGAQVAEIHINTVVDRVGTGKRDVIWGGKDDDIVDAKGGNDLIKTGSGWDVIDAGAGRDKVFAGDGDDAVYAGAGNDFVKAGDGDDTVDGGAGRDKIFGGSGEDQIKGGAGKDLLIGGKGDDVFHFADGSGKDVVWDFDRRGDDRIALGFDGVESFQDVLDAAHETRRGVELDFGADEIFLRRVDLEDLSADDFLFV